MGTEANTPSNKVGPFAPAYASLVKFRTAPAAREAQRTLDAHADQHDSDFRTASGTGPFLWVRTEPGEANVLGRVNEVLAPGLHWAELADVRAAGFRLALRCKVVDAREGAMASAGRRFELQFKTGSSADDAAVPSLPPAPTLPACLGHSMRYVYCERSERR